jgi:hypothetical protein
MQDDELPKFERCPRCLKAWDPFSVYRCPWCGELFCACCDLEQPVERSLRWLQAALAEVLLDRCPICTGPIGDEDKVGVIWRNRRT